jgi:hypothetical protein
LIHRGVENIVWYIYWLSFPALSLNLQHYGDFRIIHLNDSLMFWAWAP